MPTVVLMRHAQAESGHPDRHRVLTRMGSVDAVATGQWIRNNGFAPECAVVSPAVRTRETYMHLGLSTPAAVVEELYNCAPAVLIAVTQEHLSAVGHNATLLVVGHYPGVRDATAILAPTADIVAFTTGTAIALSFPSSELALGDGTQLGVFHP